jgi:hypothetical protein
MGVGAALEKIAEIRLRIADMRKDFDHIHLRHTARQYMEWLCDRLDTVVQDKEEEPVAGHGLVAGEMFRWTPTRYFAWSEIREIHLVARGKRAHPNEVGTHDETTLYLLVNGHQQRLRLYGSEAAEAWQRYRLHAEPDEVMREYAAGWIV